MVHDLRNPLSSVLALLRVIQEDLVDPQLKADAEIANAAAMRIQESLDDVLRIRLLEEAKLALDLQVHPVAGIAGEAIATIAPAAREREIELTLAAMGRRRRWWTSSWFAAPWRTCSPTR